MLFGKVVEQLFVVPGVLTVEFTSGDRFVFNPIPATESYLSHLYRHGIYLFNGD